MYKAKIHAIGIELEFEEKDIKDLWKRVSFFQSLPLTCPIDDTPTRLYYKEPEGYSYFSVCNTGSLYFEYKLGQAREGGELFPKGEWWWWDWEKKEDVLLCKYNDLTPEGEAMRERCLAGTARREPVMVDTETGEILMSQQNGSGRAQNGAAPKHTTTTTKAPQRPVQQAKSNPVLEDVDYYAPDEGIPFGHEDNPFNDPPKPAPVSGGVNPKKLNVLNALGSTFYNKHKNDDAWDKKREELCNSFGLTSSVKLSNEQCDKLIAGLEKRTREIITQSNVFQPGELTVVVQECTAYGDKDGVMSLDEAKGVGLAKVLQEVKRRAKVVA